MSEVITVAQLMRAAADLALHQKDYDTCILIRHMLTWHIGEPWEQAAPYKSAGVERETLTNYLREARMMSGPFNVIPCGAYKDKHPNDLLVTQLIYARDEMAAAGEVNCSAWLGAIVKRRQREIEAEENRKIMMTRNRGNYRNNWKRNPSK